MHIRTSICIYLFAFPLPCPLLAQTPSLGMVLVAVQGCAHGALDDIYAAVAAAEAHSGKKVRIESSDGGAGVETERRSAE